MNRPDQAKLEGSTQPPDEAPGAPRQSPSLAIESLRLSADSSDFDDFDPLVEDDDFDARLLFGEEGAQVEPVVHRFSLKTRYANLSLAATHERDQHEIHELGFCAHNGDIRAVSMVDCLAWLKSRGPHLLDHRPVEIGEPTSGLCVRVAASPNGAILRLEQDPRVSEIFENGALRILDRIHAIVRPNLGEKTFAALRRGHLVEGDYDAGPLGRLIARLRQKVPILWTLERSRMIDRGVPPRLEVRSQTRVGEVHVHVDIVYGDPPFAHVRDEHCWIISDDGLPSRDIERERGLSRALEAWLGLPSGRQWVVRGVKAQELAKRLTQPAPEAIFVDSSNQPIERDAVDVQAQVVTRKDGVVSLSFRPTRQEGDEPDDEDLDDGISALAMLHAFQAGHGFVNLADGRLAKIPVQWIEEHLDLLLAALEQGSKRLDRWNKHALWDLRELLSALDQPPPIDLAGLIAAPEDFDPNGPVTLPRDFQGELRPYQIDGVRWLEYLKKSGFGCLLADDMGLGKTIQAICVLAPRTLIVAPTSLLPNWKAELSRFRPELSVNTYSGPGRILETDSHVVLTSFAILRQDVEQLAATPWRTLIIDEAQSIKNPASRVAQAAFRLQAEFRLALTGTPIENRLGDLWSIFHSLNPGLLGGRRSFLRRYDTPIARQQPASNERLKRRVAPFLLRRTKDQVLTDLPEKNESVIYVELSAQERSIYDSVRAATQADIVSNLAPQHVTLGVLEALMRLRQAACHPGLLPGYTDLRGQPSTKIEILRQKLVELAAEGHKALVFSQWSSMLDLMEPHLQSAGLRCLRLDGRTRDRAGVVRDFQGDDDAPSQADVLLATLKVGGVGLNLTAADYVFIVDPWWNGAAERQASDRAHRIGQTRPVFVHRLVAVQTIEERVLAMAQGKLALAEAITGEQVAASLSRDDLLHLLDQ